MNSSISRSFRWLLKFVLWRAPWLRRRVPIRVQVWLYAGLRRDSATRFRRITDDWRR